MISTIIIGQRDSLFFNNLDLEIIKKKIGLVIKNESFDVLSLEDLKKEEAALEPDEIKAILIVSESSNNLDIINYCFEKYIEVYMTENVSLKIEYPCVPITIKQNKIYKIQRLVITGWGKIIKRTIDIVGSLAAIILFSPILIILSILVKITSPGPVIFAHSRLGELNKPMKIYKFRSMSGNAEQILRELLANNPAMREEYETTYKIKDDPRVTPLGKWMRKTSMDELPQFFNVLKGDLSLVGPRPVVKSEIAKYGEYASTLLRVKPGLTGLWQVSGRNDLDYSQKVKLDIEYINNWSIKRDLLILIKTPLAVFSKKGAS